MQKAYWLSARTYLFLNGERKAITITMGEISERYEALFRLRSLTVMEHPILGSLHMDFCKGDIYPLGVYTSVIIGANGIGKSCLLRVIAEVFCLLENLHEEKEYAQLRYFFKIEYVSHWEELLFSNIRKMLPNGFRSRRYEQFVFVKNGTDVDAKSMILPKRVIASSTTMMDKYVAKSTEMYRYKGLRSEKSPSTTGTRTLVRKTVESLLGSLHEKYGFRKELCGLLEQLGLQPRLELAYSLRYKQQFVKEGISRFELVELFENQEGHFGKRKTMLWGTHNFNHIKEQEPWLLDNAAAFLDRLARRGFDDGRNMLWYDLLSGDERVVQDREALKVLSQLDLLSYPTLRVWKREEAYEFGQSSSGESSLLCQMVGIMSDIEPNSLVLIDEPEASAHPNWQINYIAWLKRIFERYFNCHFLISTHSHFMLTDLHPETSDIVALEKDVEGRLKDVSEGVNTFNWTVDDILYRVFHVRNTRNYVLEGKTIELYQMVSNRSEDKEGIMGLIGELSRYEINLDDPLRKLLITAREYVESI